MEKQQILPYIVKCIEESGSDPRSQIVVTLIPETSFTLPARETQES